jgi:hypothetical protein
MTIKTVAAKTSRPTNRFLDDAISSVFHVELMDDGPQLVDGPAVSVLILPGNEGLVDGSP